MKKELLRIAVLPTLKTLCVAYGIFMLIIEIVIGIWFGSLEFLFGQTEGGSFSGFILALFLSFVFGLVITILSTLVFLWTYNIAAKWVGGIVIHLEDKG